MSLVASQSGSRLAKLSKSSSAASPSRVWFLRASGQVSLDAPPERATSQMISTNRCRCAGKRRSDIPARYGSLVPCGCRATIHSVSRSTDFGGSIRSIWIEYHQSLGDWKESSDRKTSAHQGSFGLVCRYDRGSHRTFTHRAASCRRRHAVTVVSEPRPGRRVDRGNRAGLRSDAFDHGSRSERLSSRPHSLFQAPISFAGLKLRRSAFLLPAFYNCLTTAVCASVKF